MIKIFKNNKRFGVQKITLDIEDFQLYQKYNWQFSQNRKNGVIYLVVKINVLKQKEVENKYFIFHRLLLKAENDVLVDHINGDGLDNRKNNLRFCDRTSNGQNSRKKQKGIYTSKYKGVHFHKLTGKWRATIMVNKKHISLGLFRLEIDAANAYDNAAELFFGQFARTNKTMLQKVEK